MPARHPEPPDFAASQLFLRRLAYSLVRDEARAEDLVQETWATWVERRPSGLAEPRAWLARVLRNRAFNLKRTDERRARREELAGRPDPSAPETDGTLEAQAQLLEALRKLEEPYRSTLVQRYYHDLAPSAIAERAGAPLNTVKARLARGLEKLRGEMDRRYHGDRRAWCHWLTSLGAPPVPVTVPASPTSAGPQASAASGSSLLGWLGIAAAVVAGGLWRSNWRSEPRPPPPAVATDPVRPAEVPRIERSESIRENPTDESRAERESALETVANLAAPAAPPLPALGYGGNGGPVRERFDWPQYGGGPAHDNYRALEDEIHAPKVLWFVPGCAGQPTLDGDDLYTGGLTVARLDTATGIVEALGVRPLLDGLGLEAELGRAGMEMLLELMKGTGDMEKLGSMDPGDLNSLIKFFGDAEDLEDRFAALDINDPAVHTAAGSPALTSKRVFVRCARDGSVIAFDRDLGEEAWHWESGWDPADKDSASTRVPLCVTEEDVVLVPLHGVLIALRAKDGRELWRYPVNGVIEMTPAAADGRVFFGTDRGLFVALSATTGEVLWQAGGDELAPVAPVVLGGRVLAVTDPSRRAFQPDNPAKVTTWDVRTGSVLWEHPVFSRPAGLGVLEEGREVAFPRLSGIDKVELKTGKDDFSGWIDTQTLPQGTPVIVGKSIVYVDEEGRISVHDIEGSRALRWSFQLPRRVVVSDLVHSGKRLYVATSIGLFCLADDEERAAVEPGFVLSWDGNSRLPSYLADEEK